MMLSQQPLSGALVPQPLSGCRNREGGRLRDVGLGPGLPAAAPPLERRAVLPGLKCCPAQLVSLSFSISACLHRVLYLLLLESKCPFKLRRKHIIFEFKNIGPFRTGLSNKGSGVLFLFFSFFFSFLET